jgi:alkyl sulfatase BDS1-like metallo-beta-lactamase superfamily hydrolase
MPEPRDPKPASEHTARANEEVAASLGFDDEGDWGRATRGLVTTHATGAFDGPLGTAWDVAEYDFLRDQEEAPPSVNPSLWRQGRLNAVHGLFEVAEGIWQCRGYDISNITFIAGDTGWLIIDPLTSEACAKACLDLANAELGERPVVGVIYTHSHIDHFGGVRGVVTDEQVASGQVRIIAPDEFLREAVFENVIAGPAMGRRANYQFGMTLPAGPRQHVAATDVDRQVVFG